MRIIQVYRPTNEGTEYNMVYIEEDLFNFLNLDKLNCISEDELNKGIEDFMNSDD